MILQLDEQNRIIFASPDFQRLFLHSFDDIFLKTIDEIQLFHRPFAELKRHTLSLQERQKEIRLNLWAYPKKGLPIFVECEIYLVSSPVTDTTKHHIISLQELPHRYPENEEFYAQDCRLNHLTKFICQLIPQSIHVINASNYLIECANESAQLGVLDEESFCYKLTHGYDEPCHLKGELCPILQMKKDPKPIVMEHVHRFGTKKIKIHQLNVYPILDKDGNLEKIIEYNVDMTKAEEVRTLLEVITSAPQLAIYIVDCSTKKKLFVNQGFFDLWGIEDEKDFSSHEDIILFLNPILKTNGVDLSEKGKNYDQIITLPDERFIHFRASCFQDKELHYHWRYFIFEDVTQREKMRKRLEQEEYFVNMGKMVSVVRHEIGNPINALKTAIQVLKTNFEKFDTRKKYQYLDRIQDDIERMERFLGILKNYGMYDNIRCQPVNWRDFIEEFVFFMNDEIHRRNIEILFLFPEQELQVMVDRHSLHQVFLNIFINAFHALEGKKHPEIEVRSLIKNDYLECQIIDNGIGIPEEILDNVFDFLFTTKNDGSGIGLTLCKQIMLKMGGDILISSKENVGTTVRLLLPLYQDTRNDK